MERSLNNAKKRKQLQCPQSHFLSALDAEGESDECHYSQGGYDEHQDISDDNNTKKTKKRNLSNILGGSKSSGPKGNKRKGGKSAGAEGRKRKRGKKTVVDASKCKGKAKAKGHSIRTNIADEVQCQPRGDLAIITRTQTNSLRPRRLDTSESSSFSDAF